MDHSARDEDKVFKRAPLGSWVRGLVVQWWIWSNLSHGTLTVKGRKIILIKDGKEDFIQGE